MGYLESLAERVAGVTDEQLAAADRLVNKAKGDDADHVVGTLSTELQRLFCVMHAAKLASKQIKHDIELELEAGGELTEDMRDRYSSAKREVAIVGSLFWHSVRTEHPALANKGSIGVRAGWQVTWDESAELDIAEILSAIHDMVGADRDAGDEDSAGPRMPDWLANFLGRRRREPTTVN